MTGATLFADPEMQALLGGLLAVLVAATGATRLIENRAAGARQREIAANLKARVNAWWVMIAVFATALLAGRVVTLCLFFLISFLCLREVITLLPTRTADHRTLLWVFFVLAPAQYLLIGFERYGIFSIFIPVYAFLFIPIRSALRGDTEAFLARTASIQWALMVSVYLVSHAPALLILTIPGYEGETFKLMVFLLVVVQGSDVLQYIFGKTLGRRPIAPKLSPNKTVEGFVGGILSATALGAALWWITPFSPLAAAGMALLCALMGFAGGLVMSAIKRDRGIKDYGSLLPGHGGMLDRIDSLCFAAPVFFHVTRFFYEP